MKVTDRWYSDRIKQEITVARWGHFGTPVLVFPTAGGDAEEIERMGLVDACGPHIDSGRVKIFSCDSVAGRAMVSQHGDTKYRMWLLNQFHQCVVNEIVPAIHTDLGGQSPLIVTAGASIGAFNAMAMLCRYPQFFGAAIGMSGSYTIERFMDNDFAEDMFWSSPVAFLPGLEGATLDLLRQRFALLASGEGAWENIGESWKLADILGRKGIPNRVDSWGPDWEHDWGTWRVMLPRYLEELC
jgi:esterase/lipase superfamily enzyme